MVYNQSQSEILIRILEVVFKKETAFWLYCILCESILPLNFYTNTLYPQAFLEYTIKLVKTDDRNFFDMCGDAINMFCLKSYYSLFTNLAIDENNPQGCQKSEMAYFMLDLLFLLGDPRTSITLTDDTIADGNFRVGEAIPSLDRTNQKLFQESLALERRIRIDRTSQLLISMSITIAEAVKAYYNRSQKSFESRQEKIRTLSGFEEIVRDSVIDKSKLLTDLLNVEIFYFSKKNNENAREEKSYEAFQFQMNSR